MLAFITSYRGHPLSPTDLLIEDPHPDFSQSGLKTKSVVKLDKLVTVESAILIGELGELSDALLQQANVKLRHALDL